MGKWCDNYSSTPVLKNVLDKNVFTSHMSSQEECCSLVLANNTVFIFAAPAKNAVYVSVNVAYIY